MQDEKGNDRAGESAAQNGADQEISSKRDLLISIVEISGGLIFGSLTVASAEAGFHNLGFFFGYLTVVCGLAIIAHYLEKVGLKYVKTSFLMSLILMAAIFGILAFHKPPAESELHPHFKFGVGMGNPPFDDEVNLTNSFLIATYSGKPTAVLGYLVIPVPIGQSNVIVYFSVINNSSALAEHVEVCFSISKELECVPDERMINSPIWMKASSNEKQSSIWASSDFILLSGNGVSLPGIQFKNVPMGMPSKNPPIFSIIAKSGDSSVDSIKFGLFFFSQKNDFSKPFIVGVTTNSNRAKLSMPTELFNKFP
jgi:hypothetical protein